MTHARCFPSLARHVLLCCDDTLFIEETIVNEFFSLLVGDNTKATVVSALRLLIDLLRTNEPFPVHTYGEWL